MPQEICWVLIDYVVGKVIQCFAGERQNKSVASPLVFCWKLRLHCLCLFARSEKFGCATCYTGQSLLTYRFAMTFPPDP